MLAGLVLSVEGRLAKREAERRVRGSRGSTWG
jgi:hypothetical protein